MNKRAIRCLAFALTLSLIVGFTVKACSSPELAETTGEKSEWSTLQAIEFAERDKPLREPVLRKLDEEEILGVPGASGQNTWIMLRPESPPFYKQMPEGQYDLPAVFVDKLEQEHRVSYTVGAVLRSHVRKK